MAFNIITAKCKTFPDVLFLNSPDLCPDDLVRMFTIFKYSQPNLLLNWRSFRYFVLILRFVSYSRIIWTESSKPSLNYLQTISSKPLVQIKARSISNLETIWEKEWFTFWDKSFMMQTQLYFGDFCYLLRYFSFLIDQKNKEYVFNPTHWSTILYFMGQLSFSNQYIFQ